MTDTVETYLDRLFDLLAGSGAAGRRVLLEAQAHLDEAVERAVASGVAPGEAERAAIARFGSAEEIALAHVNAGALPFATALGRIFAAGWFMGGVGGVAIGLMGLLDALFAAVAGASFITKDPADISYSAARCSELGVFNGDAIACRAASIAHHAEELRTQPLVIGAVALVLLALYALARRIPALRAVTRLPNAAMMATAGAVAFGGIGLLFCADGFIELALGKHEGVGAHLTQGIAGVAAGLLFLPAAWRQLTLERQ